MELNPDLLCAVGDTYLWTSENCNSLVYYKLWKFWEWDFGTAKNVLVELFFSDNKAVRLTDFHMWLNFILLHFKFYAILVSLLTLVITFNKKKIMKSHILLNFLQNYSSNNRLADSRRFAKHYEIVRDDSLWFSVICQLLWNCFGVILSDSWWFSVIHKPL